jgi:hypothetical protein
MMTSGLQRTSVLDGAPPSRDIEPTTSPIPLPADPPTDQLPLIDDRAPSGTAVDDDRHTRQAAVLAAFLGLILLVALLNGLGLI